MFPVGREVGGEFLYCEISVKSTCFCEKRSSLRNILYFCGLFSFESSF